MCRATTCRVCGKTTWAGCGQHVQDVRRGVRASDWCDGSHTAEQIATSKASRPGLLARLFGN